LSTKQAQGFQKVGHLPEKEAEAIPWDKFALISLAHAQFAE
jgi:hypothetical protein